MTQNDTQNNSNRFNQQSRQNGVRCSYDDKTRMTEESSRMTRQFDSSMGWNDNTPEMDYNGSPSRKLKTRAQNSALHKTKPVKMASVRNHRKTEH